MISHRHPGWTAARRGFLVALIGFVAACGGSDDADTESASAQSAPAAPVGGDLSEAASAEAELPPVPDSSARLSLANGEVLEFSITCVLRTQVVNSFEVLFTAESSGSPSISIMQQGDGGRASATASISVKGADSKSVWEASSLYVNSGGTAALSLSDSVITGVGGFFPAADYDKTPIYGTLTATC